MKNAVKTVIEIMVTVCGVLMIIHRHVISACLTGDPLPEAPEWHKKCMPFLSGTRGE